MSKQSSSKLIFFRYLHYQPSKPSTPRTPISSTPLSQLISHDPKLIPSPFQWIPSAQTTRFTSSSISSHFQNLSQVLPRQTNLNSSLLGFRLMQKAHFTSSSTSRISQNPVQRSTKKPNLSYVGFRYISMGSSNLGSRVNLNLVKSKVKEPTAAVTKAFSRYKHAVGLQIEAFWRRNSLVLLGAGGVVVCILLWRIMFGIANAFVGLSEGMAKYGFLALSSAIVAFAGLYLRSRFTINPDKVYRMAMTKLNTSANILEIMGAPLTGTDLRAYVMSGGGITLKNFKAGLRSKRCFLIFPIRGSEMKGLVSVEVKNKKGKYDMKLLSVDIPMATGPDQRLFLIGDEEEYRVGGGLISELRDPVIKAMAATKEFEDRDLKEDKEDAERELQEAERKHQEEVERIQREGS